MAESGDWAVNQGGEKHEDTVTKGKGRVRSVLLCPTPVGDFLDLIVSTSAARSARHGSFSLPFISFKESFHLKP